MTTKLKKLNDKPSARQSAYDTLSRLATAFSSPARLKIIQILSQSGRNVEEVAKLIGESTANASQHLQRLSREGIVTGTRRGTVKTYSISDPKVLIIWEALQDLGDKLSPGLKEREDYLTDFSLISQDPLDKILKRVRKGDALLIDVREEQEFLASSVAGAQNIPVLKFKTSSDLKKLHLPKKKPMYLFCRGRFCSMATTVVALLRQEGYDAYRLVESPYRLRLISGGKGESKSIAKLIL